MVPRRSVPRAVILAGGRVSAPAVARVHLAGADLLICADGGLRTARQLGLEPDIAIGDFDSASAALRAWAGRRGARIIVHPAAKDKTDAELALDCARAEGVRQVEFFGALGGRLDHELANVALLLRARAAGITLRIIDGGTEAFLAGRRTAILADRGDWVSLLALSRRVSRITTSGLRYPLRAATLEEGSSLGVSNEVSGRHPAVHVGVGDLLVVVTRRAGTPRRLRS